MGSIVIENALLIYSTVRNIARTDMERNSYGWKYGQPVVQSFG